MKRGLIQFAITCLFLASSTSFQEPTLAQNGDFVKRDDLGISVVDSVLTDDSNDSIRIYCMYIKQVNKDTQKKIIRTNKKIMLLQSVVMRTSISSIWPDGRIIPPPAVENFLTLPEPAIDTTPVVERKRGIFKRKK